LGEPVTKLDDWASFFADLRSVNSVKFEQSIRRLESEVVEPLDRKRRMIAEYLQELMSLAVFWSDARSNIEQFNLNLSETIGDSLKAALEGLEIKLLQQLRYAVMAMWQPIDCKDMYKAAHQTSDAICQGIIEPFVSHLIMRSQHFLWYWPFIYA
ncbi:hypothetical protein Ciccas_014381, partial [Cichlidogyrus casuarinus]